MIWRELFYMKFFILLVIIYSWNCLSVTPFPLLVISFDGFRYDYLDKYPTPNFKRMAETGVRAKWMTSVFTTKTFPNHFSIITGLYEESHGIVGNYMFDPIFNETFVAGNDDPKWWYNGHSLPIWVANQNAGANRHSGSVMWLSTNVPYEGQHIKYLKPYNPDVPWEERMDLALRWLTAQKDPANIVLLYIQEPDAMGHQFGPDSEQVGNEVIKADKLIGYLFEKLTEKKILDKLNFIVLSDHGMAEVPEKNLIFLDNILAQSLYSQYGHSPVWNILPKPGQEELVRSKLVEGTNLYPYTLYEKDSIPLEYHYRNNRRVMPFVIEANEGWDFFFNRSSVWRNSTGGDHGYNNSLMSMHPIFLAHGPSFKSGFLAEPFLNLDVYPLMCHLLDLPLPKNVNGSMEGVKQLLVEQKLAFEISGTWIVAGVTLFCVSLAGVLMGVVISTACKKPPPTVAFVPLKHHLLYPDEPCTGEEYKKLLHAADAD